jgi:hypothetical protein
VSARPNAELSEADRRFQDGTDPKLLDVVRIPMAKYSPHGFQTENHQIDDQFYWVRERQCTAAELKAALDSPPTLWDNNSSSGNGLNDRVADATAATLKDSLLLIGVPKLTISVAVEGAAFNNAKRKVRGTFTYKNTHYTLAITDPLVERAYLQMADGVYDAGPLPFA